MSPAQSATPARAKDASIAEALGNIGIPTAHTNVIEVLLRGGSANAQELEAKLKWPRATLYRILKEMVSEGHAALTPGRPAVYSAPPLDALITRRSQEAQERLAALEETLEALSPIMAAIRAESTGDGEGELRFIHGRQEAYAGLTTVIRGAKHRFDGVFLDAIGASWCVASGALDVHRATPGLPKRLVYSDTEVNRATVRGMQPLDSTTFRFVDQQSDTRFAVADTHRLFAITHPGAGRRFKEPSEVGLTTTARGLVAAHQALFDNLWNIATP